MGKGARNVNNDQVPHTIVYGQHRDCKYWTGFS